MKLYHTDHFELPLPSGHRFPMAKYRLLRDRLRDGGVFSPRDFLIPPAATREELLRAHAPQYVERVLTGTLAPAEIRRLGFPWSPELVERSRRSVGATLAAARRAFQERVAVNLAGGTHHAHADHGGGFCVFNDVAVAIRVLQAEDRVKRALVIDLDVHQGDGTAAIFAGDETVFTFSMHGARNYPLHKPPSNLDIPLPDGTADADYLAALEAGLAACFAACPSPQLVCYVAGADPYEQDRLGRMKLTKQGLRERDRRVFAACAARRLPVAVTMGGGYCRAVEKIVDIHEQTVLAARTLWCGRAE